MNRDHLRVATSWLNDLANLTAGPTPLADSKPKIATMAAALAEDFPAAAFTRQSLVVVARAAKFFPSYSEICAILSPWWKERRPKPIAIASDQPAAVRQREIEREARESWQNITPEQVRSKIRAVRDGWQPRTYGSFLASALRKHAPQHLGMLPPEWLVEHTEPADVVALRRMRET